MRKLISFVVAMSAGASVWAGGFGGKCGMGMGMGGGCSKVPVYLLALALGYWVLRLAEAEVKPLLKKVGRVVSWIILLVGIGGLLCPLLTCSKKGMLCGMCAKKGMMSRSMADCPMTGAAGADMPSDAAPEK